MEALHWVLLPLMCFLGVSEEPGARGRLCPAVSIHRDVGEARRAPPPCPCGLDFLSSGWGWGAWGSLAGAP